jgi:hypothetical protein
MHDSGLNQLAARQTLAACGLTRDEVQRIAAKYTLATAPAAPKGNSHEAKAARPPRVHQPPKVDRRKYKIGPAQKRILRQALARSAGWVFSYRDFARIKAATFCNAMLSLRERGYAELVQAADRTIRTSHNLWQITPAGKAVKL